MKKIVPSLIILIILFWGCKKVENSTGVTPVTTIKKDKISGLIQKGPYVKGTSILMFELNQSLLQTGKVYSSQILNSSGLFEIDSITLSSPYVLSQGSGYYFNEVTGQISSSPLTLYAYSDITDRNSINLNILTNLEKLRIEYLLKQKTSFAEAKKLAQKEIMQIFGFKPNNDVLSESLNISYNDSSNAKLLAITVILQGNLDVGQLSELMGDISVDIQPDGILNDTTIISKLINSAKQMDLTAIRLNLEKRYESLGIKVNIPNFEFYVNTFCALKSTSPKIEITQLEYTDATSILVSGKLLETGGMPIINIGIAMSTNYNPTINDAKQIIQIDFPLAAGDPMAFFLDKLSIGVKYHLRIFATNFIGTSYSQDTTITPTPPTTPILSTSIISEIKGSSAMTGGKIISDGRSPITAKGVVWSKSSNPTIELSNKTIDGQGTIEYSSRILGLEVKTQYHIRAYATNQVGTSYGDEYVFVTMPNLIIGEPFRGGILAYLLVNGDTGYDPNTPHGLIVSEITDQMAKWSDGSLTVVATPDDGFGMGLNNSNIIIKYQGADASSYAAGIARAYRGGGYDDWYLPSIFELRILYYNHQNIGGFTYAQNYWSSNADANSQYALSREFSQGATYVDFHFRYNVVRPVRVF